MRLVILDRDGVINCDSPNYIRCPEDWRPIPGSLQAIAQLNQAGFTVAVATNQSGIARGFYDHSMLDTIHEKMHTQLAEEGGKIDRIFYCPHHPDEKCQCRKPKPGLLLQIAEYYGCDLANVAMVGDRVKDLQAAIAAGAQPIAVKTGLGSDEWSLIQKMQIPLFADLQHAVTHILGVL